MTEFRIDVVIDPSQSAAGAKVVEKQLDGIEREAAELRKALVDALAVRDTGTAAALGNIEEILLATQQRAIITDARLSQIGKDINARGLRQVNDELDKTRTKAAPLAGLLRNAFVGLSAGLLVREYAQLSDSLTNTQNRLRLVTSSATELADVQRQLVDIANRSRSAFSGTSEIFNRLAVSGKELGVTNQQLLQFTESLNQAIVLSGASAQEANAGLIQLSQGLASGTLRGDELRSVLEQLPAVADVIAKGLGVTRGELRKLGEDGKITAKQVLDAFAAARVELNDRFATTVPTIGQSLTVLQNKVTETVGKFNEATGASRAISEALLFVGNNATALSVAVGTVAAGFAAVKFTAFVAGLQAVQLQTLKTAGAIGVLTAGALAVGSIFQSIEQDQAGAAEALRNLADDSKVVPAFAKQITDLQREINALRREAEKSPTAKLTEEIETLSARLAFFREEQKRTAAEQIAASRAAAETAAQTAAARKLEEEATARQNEVLAKIRQPLADYLQLQKDLGVLLAANKITQDEFNQTLAAAKPPEPKKPVEPPKPVEVDPFRDQLDSLKQQNAELEIRANNLGIQREALLIEAELASRGVTLTREQQLALASALITRKELTDKVKEQTANEERLAKAQAEQDARLVSLREQIDLNGQINQQMNDLFALRLREAELIPQIDAAVENLRLRQLEGSRELGDGFERALIKIKQEAEDLASVAEGVVNVFANTATDAIVKFAQTGQFSFKEFATSILADITRIIARLLVVQALNAVLGSTTGGALANAAGAGASAAQNSGRARGGTVQPGMAPFPVGEDGPELFVPNRTGTIVPNPATMAVAQPAQPSVVQVVNVTDPNEVPNAINNGLADEAIVNVLTKKRDVLRQLLA